MREVELWKLLVNEILHLGGEIVEQFSGVSVPSLPVTEKCFASRQADIGVGIIEQIFQVLADGQTKRRQQLLGPLGQHNDEILGALLFQLRAEIQCTG